MAAKSRSTPTVARAAKPAKRSTVADKRANPVGANGKPEVRIFMSYSHHDAGAQEKLNRHLAPWRRDGVTVWYDENIEPGAALSTEIGRELRRAHIFVALFSPAYIDSHYCWDIEYKRAMSRRQRKLMRVVAVVVKPCGWKQTRAAGFRLLPKDGIPPESWSSGDAAYANAAQGIGDVIKAVRRELAVQPAPKVRAKAKPAKMPKPKPRSGPPKGVDAGPKQASTGSTIKSAKPRPQKRKSLTKP
ncbi:MAG: toll/interleukin-1 receptor domain-containing protein [Oxalobacteraceae bacterium]|nr:MAG: toll/interleukin-1 receptor domain-containing protein [Oxalobacteraceae bacterium]